MKRIRIAPNAWHTTTAFLLGVAFLANTPPAAAHEHDTFKIGGLQYVFTVGSLNEPIMVDKNSGVDFRVAQVPAAGGGHADHTKHADQGGAGTPVVGLDQTLKVELSAGNKKETLALDPVRNTPGSYVANFIPTVQTTYSYRIFGTIDNQPVDATFRCVTGEVSESAEDNAEVKLSSTVTRIHKVGAFGCPSSKKSVGFPEPALSSYDLSQDMQSIATAAEAAGKQAAMSQTLSIVALIVGVAGVALAGMVWKRK
jgi:hypothetical protein